MARPRPRRPRPGNVRALLTRGRPAPRRAELIPVRELLGENGRPGCRRPGRVPPRGRGHVLSLIVDTLRRLTSDHWTVYELAEDLGVTTRTVWRVLAAMRRGGLPRECDPRSRGRRPAPLLPAGPPGGGSRRPPRGRVEEREPMETHDDDLTERERDAQRIARRVLAGADLTLSWRDAGYRTAMDAARALVGDGYDDDVTAERAAEIIAEALARTEV
jgi:hypothetical protein